MQKKKKCTYSIENKPDRAGHIADNQSRFGLKGGGEITCKRIEILTLTMTELAGGATAHHSTPSCLHPYGFYRHGKDTNIVTNIYRVIRSTSRVS